MDTSALLLAFLLLSVEGRENEKRQSGPDCLHCLKVAEAHDCEVVVTCEADEECFKTQYISPQGQIFFDLGCKSKQICEAIDKFGRRSQGQPQRRQPDGRITLCEECCTGVLCNNKACDSYNGAHVYPESKTRICYSCSGEHAVEKPGDCEILTACGAHEQCFNAYGLTNDLELRSSMGCISDRACNLMYTSGGPSVGHPNTSLFLPPMSFVQQHSARHVGRDVREIYKPNHIKRHNRDMFFAREIRRDVSSMFMMTSCEYCCSDSYCNNKECVTGFTVTQKSIATTTMMQSTSRTTTTMPIGLSTSTTPPMTTSTISATMSNQSTTQTLTASIVSTITQPSTICYVCSGHACSMESCTGATPYCLNVLDNNADGSKHEVKRCGSKLECERDWYNLTALSDICSVYEIGQLYSSRFSCTYCCVGNYCNRDTNPPRETLYYPNRQNA